MADYEKLSRSRAAFLGQIKPIVTEINAFDVLTSSVNCIAQWKSSLEAIKDKHQSVIDDMMVHEDADYNEIAELAERFRAPFFQAMTLLDDCKDSTRLRQYGEQKKLIHGEIDALTIQLVEVESFKDAYDAERSSVSELRSRSCYLEPLREKFMNLYNEIFPGSDEQTKTHLNALNQKFSASFFSVTGWLADEVSRRAPALPNEIRQAASNDWMSIQAKLPRIELEKFDGTPDRWVPWRDQFKSLIHNQSKLPGSTKFRYLKSTIIDKHSPVNHLLETDDGYEDAWNAVLKYYDDERRILDSHFGSMLTAKRMTAETHDELQRIINDYTLHTASIERMFSKESLYDSLVAHLVTFRLDAHTRDLWETQNKNKIPLWPVLQEFLQERRKTLSTIPAPKVASKPATSSKGWRSSNVNAIETNESDSEAAVTTSAMATSVTNSTNNPSRAPNVVLKCRMCRSEHKLHACREFGNLTVNARLAKVRELKLCENCFSPSHTLGQCSSNYKCRHCQQMHHSLLHQELNTSALPFQSNVSCNTISSHDNISLLQTAMVKIRDSHGEWHNARAFLDSGADSNFITAEVVKALNLQMRPTHVEANGLGGNRLAVIRHAASANLSNDDESDDMELDFLVTPKVTNPTPVIVVDRLSLGIPDNLILADPTFNVPGKIDILLGNKVYGKLMRNGKYELTSGIILLNTMFGWVFTGSTSSHTAARTITTTSCNHSTLVDLKNSIERFYKLEDYKNDKQFLTDEQAFCEENFEQTHERSPDGTFTVHTPFKKNVALIEPNDRSTYCQFLSNEKRLQKNESQREQYGNVMQEYEDSGHMKEVDVTKDPPGLKTYYLPHHGVVKMDSTTTKLRVVFNGSSKTSSGISLNDAQCIGPNVQTDSFSLGLRFRQHRIAIKADIAKMYRQIKIVEHHRPYQRIFWRKDPADSIKVCELSTVTFGMAASAFLATRALKQAGLDSIEKFPQASQEIIDNFYVDDWLSGECSVENAIALAKDVVKILDGAGMKLRKFSSNSREFIEAIPEEDREVVDDGMTLKALGLRWNERKDVYGFDVQPMVYQRVTKRIALSEMSRIYDPDGMLGPVTFKFKLFMKDVHKLKTSWDAPLPTKEEDEWKELAGTFEELKKIEIPRHFLIDSPTNIQLHGFCDASDKGYGAAVYVVSRDAGGRRMSHLVCAKSRIAPTEYRSTARLELCGAVLLSHLMTRVGKALTIIINKRFCWTDSTIILHWFKKSPALLQTFVANRVSEVQELTAEMTWRHVRSGFNPADLISRGILPMDLSDCLLWWHGPGFLFQHENQWPETMIELNPENPSYANEFKKLITNVNVASTVMSPENNIFLKWIEDSSRSFHLKRKISYVLRFIFNIRAKKSGNSLRYGPINVQETTDAEHALIRICQQAHFKEEYRKLSAEKSIPLTSSIKNLSPFWDSQLLLIRVGGRLDNAQCNEDQKHPILLPNCHLTKMIIRETHERNLHAGQLSTLGTIRMKYWPIRGRQIIKQQIHKCVKCFRARPKMISQFMGSLPASRVTPTPAFYHTGVDYCGPFNVKVSSIRSARAEVVYVALFVCLATKAIHLEIVSKLSTDAFFCAFDKFVSRRGFPRSMHSDHGLNFVGANNEMKKFYEFLRKSTSQSEIRQYLLDQEVEWHFIPPRAPEHGGLWEAGVKSFKYHFTRVAGNSLLTFEEFDQLKAKIEAILNSRPLTALGEDPNDFAALTPGHFLIGRPLVSKPEQDFTSQPISRLQRWQRVSQMQQHFWQRWSQDYLHQLQIRTKNFKVKIPVSEGQLVLLHVENSPSMIWPLGRITKIYPGKDGITRVASVKTSKSTYERPVTKLALLPIDDDDQLLPRENVNVAAN